MTTDTTHLTTTGPFVAPTAGSWELDLAHFSPDASRIVRDAMEVAMSEGMEEGFELAGAPVKTMHARFINGRFYRRLVPLVGASKDLPPPPDIVLKIATRLHPGFRARTKRAAVALESRFWLDELRQWEEEWKPAMVAKSRALAAHDLSTVGDGALASIVEESYAHVLAGLRLHFRLHTSDLGPIGLLLVRARDWNLSQIDVMQSLSGYSLATSAPALALARIRELAPGPLTSLDDVRAAGPEAAAALDDFLLEYGGRLTGGYDIGSLTLAEMPDTVLAGIRAADDATVDEDAQRRGDAMAAKLREQVPANDRVEFDRLLADARSLYGLRDENGPITYQWPAGLLRKIVLEVGRRLAADGRVDHADHVFDLSAAEMAQLLRGGSSLTAASIAQRFETRQSWADLDAPRLLGPEPVIPSLDVLPGPLAELMDIILTVLELIESPLDRQTTADMKGVGIGSGSFTGRARVVGDALDALAEFEPGDVLVTPYTVPTVNSVLAMAGAVVTEEGGLLSHAAVIAREFGIPAVIGIDNAAQTIADGATIEVDAAAGTVVVVDAELAAT